MKDFIKHTVIVLVIFNLGYYTALLTPQVKDSSTAIISCVAE